MTAALIVAGGAYGVYLVYTATAFGWRGVGIGDTSPRRTHALRGRAQRWMAQAGLAEVAPRELIAASALLTIIGGAIGYLLFASVAAAAGVALCSATTPFGAYRQRRRTRRAIANESWPQMIEEIRVLTGAAGRSIPQALLEVGARGPEELRGAFSVAQRQWLLTTDFEETVEMLKSLLADPTADATLETLLVAHEVGGSDIDRRLEDLAEDRRLDNLGRRDARAQQAGVRFARRFVIAVPLGMALAGMSFGDGRQAYTTAWGQVMVAAGIALVAACWVWSAQMLRLPEQERVFGR